jgi:exopolyphosphatase/guanosine-5'-triphosphate,3'-diphosphate pyrophosphatase
VGTHRRKLSREHFERVAGREGQELALHLALLLRLAVRLHHSRSRERLPEPSLRVGQTLMTLEFPRGWLEERPLTRADLEEEAELLGAVGIRLRFGDAARAPAPRRKARRA